mgnify:CR=1 FL=1
MSEEQSKIETMVQEGKLSRADADQLLAALDEQEQPRTATDGGPRRSASRSLRIRIDEANGKTVNLRFPLALADVGLSMITHRENVNITTDNGDVPVDMEKIRSLINDPSFYGELLDVRTDSGDHVLLTVE